MEGTCNVRYSLTGQERTPEIAEGRSTPIIGPWVAGPVPLSTRHLRPGGHGQLVQPSQPKRRFHTCSTCRDMTPLVSGAMPTDRLPQPCVHDACRSFALCVVGVLWFRGTARTQPGISVLGNDTFPSPASLVFTSYRDARRMASPARYRRTDRRCPCLLFLSGPLPPRHP